MATNQATILAALLLLTIARIDASATPALWGANFSEWATFVARIGVDQSGSVYGLTNCQGAVAPAKACVTKLSADGKTLLWQNPLDFPVAYGSAMTVDPLGNAYVIPAYTPDRPAVTVAKLNPAGSGLAWTATVTRGAYIGNPTLAADAQGRVYIAGPLGPTYQSSTIVRLTPSGAIDYAASVPGNVVALAVDRSGAAYVAAIGTAPFLTRLAPDGSAGYTVALTALANAATLAIAADPAGNIAVLGAAQGSPGTLVRLDSKGNVTSLPCGSEWIGIFAPDGSLLQTTWAPPSGRQGTATAPLVAAGPDSTLYIAGAAAAGFSPSQAGPFGAAAGQYLWRVSPNASPDTVRLACLGNAATYLTTPIAPGVFITLFGSGLGPQPGVQTQASPASPFTVQAAGVQVTFDGLPAPLLWVQDSQINVLAPWSLTAGAATRVCASYNTAPPSCLTWPVAQTDPAVFTTDGTHAVALRQNGTFNSASNPAAPGEIVTVIATGLGPVSPPQPDGSIVTDPSAANILPVGVSYVIAAGGPPVPTAYPCEVTYAGPAPQLVAGASQINFRVPPVTGEVTFVVTLPSSASPEFRIYVASGQGFNTHR